MNRANSLEKVNYELKYKYQVDKDTSSGSSSGKDPHMHQLLQQPHRQRRAEQLHPHQVQPLNVSIETKVVKIRKKFKRDHRSVNSLNSSNLEKSGSMQLLNAQNEVNLNMSNLPNPLNLHEVDRNVMNVVNQPVDTQPLKDNNVKLKMSPPKNVKKTIVNEVIETNSINQINPNNTIPLGLPQNLSDKKSID